MMALVSTDSLLGSYLHIFHWFYNSVTIPAVMHVSTKVHDPYDHMQPVKPASRNMDVLLFSVCEVGNDVSAADVLEQ